MSTFTIEGNKFLEGIIPEWNWDELRAEQYEDVFSILSNVGQLATEVVGYLQKKKIKIGFHKQYKSGGGWTILRNITLSPGDKPADPYGLSLIIHETFHLQQSIWMRLSMQGELRAWQYQKQVYSGIARIKGSEIGSQGEAYGGTQKYWDELSKLSTESREDLDAAQEVMTKISPGYRSGCLPLYPLPKEIGYFLRQGKIIDAFNAAWKLVSCK